MQFMSLSAYSDRRRSQNNPTNKLPRQFIPEWVINRSDEEESRRNENYFCWRWSRQHFSNKMTLDSTVLPTDDEILDSILTSQQLQSFILEEKVGKYKSTGFLRHVLFELYGHDPPHLEAMSTWAKGSQATDEQLHTIVSGGNDSHSTSSFWEQLLNDDKKMCSDRMKPNFEFFSSPNPQIWSAGASVYVVLKDWRLFGGLNSFLSEQYTSTLEAIKSERIRTLKLGTPNNAYHDCHFLSCFADPTKEQETELRKESLFCQWPDLTPAARNQLQAPIRVHEQVILLSLAGSGKSQRLFDYLSVSFGHYFISGNTPSHESLTTTLLDPHCGPTSQDTKFLVDVSNRIDLASDDLIKLLWKVLLHNRHLTLTHFVGPNGLESSPFLPHDWLIFQTMSTKAFDPFLKTFKILLLIDETSHDFWPSEIFCLDEMQCEIASERSQSGINSLTLLLVALPSGSLFIGAGTSLQFLQCQNIFLRWLTPGSWILPEEAFSEPRFIEDFDGVTSDDQFHTLCHRHIDKLVSRMGYLLHLGGATEHYELWMILTPGDSNDQKLDFYQRFTNFLKTEMNLQQISLQDAVSRLAMTLKTTICSSKDLAGSLTEDIIECSLPVRGRYRWNILFIERMLAKLLECLMPVPLSKPVRLNDAINRHQIRTNLSTLYTSASKSAQQTIETQLRERIEELKRVGHYDFLIKDLYQTAVRSHLLHRPNIFQDRKSARLLEAGIARLKPLSRKAVGNEPSLEQELSEPLVLKAVIKHLRMEQGRHEQILRELLYDNQDDPSMFGKATEYYLGWAFGGLLEDKAEQIAPQKRRYFLKKPVAPIPHVPASLPSGQSRLQNLEYLQEFVVERPSPTFQNNLQLDSQFSFHGWLRCIRKQDSYFPTFYFPSNMAGPDIVFCLRHRQNTQNRILCAIQVKTGTTKVPTKDSFKVIRTLDPNLWFQGVSVDKRDNLHRQLTHLCEHGRELNILTLLVVTSLPVEDFFASAENLQKGLEQLRHPVSRYIREANRSRSLALDMEKEINNPKENYKQAERKIESISQSFLMDGAQIDHKKSFLRDAEGLINEKGKGAIKRAKSKAIKIRGALLISAESDQAFCRRFVDTLGAANIDNTQALTNAVSQLIDTHKAHEDAKHALNEPLQRAEKELQDVAEAIVSGRTTTPCIDPSLSENGNDRMFDFFFAILDKEDMRFLFDEALDELINAMKRLAARKERRATKKRRRRRRRGSGSSSNSDSDSDCGDDYETEKMPVKLQKLALH